MNEQNLYVIAEGEFESSNRNQNLFIKAMTLTQGDEKRAKYEYIRMWVESAEQNRAEERSPEPAVTMLPTNDAQKTESLHINHDEPIESDKGFFKKLYDGDFSLPRTYWLYGVLVGVLLNIVFTLMEAADAYMGIVILFILYVPYVCLTQVGIWRSANRYKGWGGWRVLAKIAVVFGWIMLISSVLAVLAAIAG